MELRDIGRGLLAVGVPVSHYFKQQQKAPYIVWAEDGQGSMQHGDNHAIQQSIQGTIDYFTRNEYDANFFKIQNVLNSMDIAWSLNSVQYEDDTQLIHYEWLWEVDIWPNSP